MIDNLRFLIHTHEKNVGLSELCLTHFFKHNKRDGLKMTLVSNKFLNNNFLHSDKVDYYSSDVELIWQGYHFRDSMISALTNITEDYVFFLLDDYFFIDEIKYDDLEDALNLMVCENIDYFGFDEVGGILTINDFEKLNTECESNIKDSLFLRHKDYQYLFSTQPCIWKRTSLLNLLKSEDKITLHDLDETLPNIRKNGLGLKGTISNLKSCFDYSMNFSVSEKPDDYFIIAYVEIVRHGCFNIPENGKPISPDDLNVRFTYKLINDEDLGSKDEFKHLVPLSLQK